MVHKPPKAEVTGTNPVGCAIPVHMRDQDASFPRHKAMFMWMHDPFFCP